MCDIYLLQISQVSVKPVFVFYYVEFALKIQLNYQIISVPFAKFSIFHNAPILKKQTWRDIYIFPYLTSYMCL